MDDEDDESRSSLTGTLTWPISLSPRVRSQKRVKTRVRRFCLAADSSTVNFAGKFHVGFLPEARSTLVLVFWWLWDSPEIETTAYTSILVMRLTSLRSLADITLISRDLSSMLEREKGDGGREKGPGLWSTWEFEAS
ncbi:hypothetical protein TorRG33x02_158910, partial [Trema orientale]